MPLDPNLAALVQAIRDSPLPAISEGTVQQARDGIRMLMVATRTPENTVAVDSVADETVADDLPVRVYRPSPATPRPTLVYFHGGGFVIGDLDTHDNVCRRLSRDLDAVVVSVDYALAPERTFPAAAEDCHAALTWVMDHVELFGDDPARIAVGGDSAGGNLAAVCTQLAHAEGRTLKAQLLVYPATDVFGEYASRIENADRGLLSTADSRWFLAQYLGMADRLGELPDVGESDDDIATRAREDSRLAELVDDARLSPLRATDLAGLPPALVITAEFDPLRDEGEAYAAALESAGVSVEQHRIAGMTHGFYGLEIVSPAIEAATTSINESFASLLA